MTPAAKTAARKAAWRKNMSVSQLFEDFIRREYATLMPVDEREPAAGVTA